MALARCGPADAWEVLEVVLLEGGTFSAQLVPQIASLLSKHGFNKKDVDVFAVASGPGSFTGLRVGLAAIKALAEILGKPIVAVSLLEAVAASASGAKKVLAALDAGRREVYAGEYEGATKMLSERLLTRQEMLAAADHHKIITPDPGLAGFARAAGAAVIEIERPQSDTIARLAWHKLRNKETISAEVLDANYIRRSDAEILSRK